VYLFTFSFLCVLALFDITKSRPLHNIINNSSLHIQSNRKKLFVSIAILWLIIHDGLRWGIGTDWHNYYEYFQRCLSNPERKSGFEFGYVSFNQIVRFFTEDYTVFLLLHAIIVYLLIRSSVIKYSPLPFVSILLFYCLMLTYLGMNRQYIAFAIAIFSYKYIFKRKIISFIIAIAIASLFHVSVLIFFPAYFLKNQISTKIILLLIMAVMIVAFSGIINRLTNTFFGIFLGRTGARLLLYYSRRSGIEDVNLINTILSLIKRVGLIILTLAIFKPSERNTPALIFFLNLYVIAALLYIMFNNTYLQQIVARGLMYYSIAEIFLVPFILLKFKKGGLRFVILLLFASYGWIQIQKGFNYYKGDTGADIFRPYNSALFDKEYDAINNRR
jgi:hypothetical protein